MVDHGKYQEDALNVCNICHRVVFGHFKMGYHLANKHRLERDLPLNFKKIKGS